MSSFCMNRWSFPRSRRSGAARLDPWFRTLDRVHSRRPAPNAWDRSSPRWRCVLSCVSVEASDGECDGAIDDRKGLDPGDVMRLRTGACAAWYTAGGLVAVLALLAAFALRRGIYRARHVAAP